MIDRRKSLEKLYKDICNIYKYTEKENEYGITKQEWQPIHEEVKCSLSKKTLNSINQTDAEAITANSMVLFLDDRVKVLSGSKIDCRGLIFYSGESFVYDGSHQEIVLSTKEYA